MEASGFMRLNLGDLGRGAVCAIASGILLSLLSIAGQANFDLFTVDWASVGHAAVNAGFAAFVGYLTKNLITDSSGKVFGRL